MSDKACVKEKVLRHWQECKGYYQGIKEEESIATVRIGTNNREIALIFTSSSSQYKCVKKALKKCAKGQIIGILRTNLPGKHVMVRRYS